MRLTENKPVNQQVTKGYKCDTCGRSVDGSLPNGWHSFEHSHEDWGNDSHESTRYFDVCSVVCFIEQLKKSLFELREHQRTADISGMNYKFAETLFYEYFTRKD